MGHPTYTLLALPVPLALSPSPSPQGELLVSKHGLVLCLGPDNPKLNLVLVIVSRVVNIAMRSSAGCRGFIRNNFIALLDNIDILMVLNSFPKQFNLNLTTQFTLKLRG